MKNQVRIKLKTLQRSVIETTLAPQLAGPGLKRLTCNHVAAWMELQVASKWFKSHPEFRRA